MIKLNFKDGSTLEFNLSKKDDLKQWIEWSSVKDFQDRITGIGILHKKQFHTLPLPVGFRSINFQAELVIKKRRGVERLVGEKLTCHADNIKLSLLVYTYDNPPAPILSRIGLARVGKQRGPYVNQILKG